MALAQDHIPLTASASDEVGSSDIPDPENRPSINEVIEEIYEQKWYQTQIKYRRNFDAKPGSIGRVLREYAVSVSTFAGTVDPPLSDNIKTALRDARNISALYTHQATAIAALSQGKNVIVSTSTASGKSVIYQVMSVESLSPTYPHPSLPLKVPLLRILEQDEGAKALFIYPTKVGLGLPFICIRSQPFVKALAQDQKAALEQLLVHCPGLEHISVCCLAAHPLCCIS